MKRTPPYNRFPGHKKISRRRFLNSVSLGSVAVATSGSRGYGTAARRADGSIDLVKAGTSQYSICLSEGASSAERRAAQELSRFVEEMSGARLPIVSDAERISGSLVLLGNSRTLRESGIEVPFTELGPEGFALKTSARRLIIAGGGERGTMYGVYALLEKLGCRWFTREVSRIPRRKTILLGPLDEIEKPAFEYREPYFREACDRDWAARNRLNGASLGLDESTGGNVGYYPFVHTFYRLIPPDRYFSDHPEYFALVDGKRRSERAQLCLTNPDVLRLSIETVLGWIVAHPETILYSVSQNDSEGWCECQNCKRIEQEEGGAHSGPILRFVNAVAAEVEKKHPDKLIDTLAYWYSEEPPARVRPRANVRVRLCPIGACEAHPYERCRHNAYFMKNLRAWSKITQQLYIWHYVTNFAHYLMPFPDFDELAADIPMYRQHGVVGIFLEGDYAEGGGGENAKLRSYVMARLLWNPRVNVEETIDEFLGAYYGKAAKPMRAYFDLLHRQVRPAPTGKGHHAWIYTRPGAPYLSEGFLAESRSLLDRACRAAEDEPALKRVEKARLSIDYLALMRSKAFTVEREWYAPPDAAGLKKSFEDFMSAVRSFGIKQLHEGVNLEQDEREFAARIKPYRIASLENGALRADLAAELNGRIIRLIDKATGEDVLRRSDPGERSYPNVGGLALYVYPDYFARRPWDVKWELRPTPEAGELLLTGACEGGLKLSNRIKLDGDDAALRLECVAENASGPALEMALQVRMETDPGSMDDVFLTFRTRGGTTVERKLVQPEEQPSGSETYVESELPDGEFRVVNTGSGSSLAVRFQDAARLAVAWSAKGEDRVTLGLWSEKRKLETGEKAKLAAIYKISRQPAAPGPHRAATAK